MHKFKDVFGDDVFLDDEVKKIILAKHPEVSKFKKRISLVLNDPETIKVARSAREPNFIIDTLKIFTKANFW
jgi:hypothetical protein